MSDDILTQILARLARMEDGQRTLVGQINTKLDEILNKLSALRTDADNTKTFLIEDALTLGRRMTSLEGRIEALEKKGG